MDIETMTWGFAMDWKAMSYKQQINTTHNLSLEKPWREEKKMYNQVNFRWE